MISRLGTNNITLKLFIRVEKMIPAKNSYSAEEDFSFTASFFIYTITSSSSDSKSLSSSSVSLTDVSKAAFSFSLAFLAEETIELGFKF